MIGYRDPDTLYSRLLPQTISEGELIATIFLNPAAGTIRVERADDLERKVEE